MYLKFSISTCKKNNFVPWFFCMKLNVKQRYKWYSAGGLHIDGVFNVSLKN